MVATRRMAQHEPEDELGLESSVGPTLRKKPVRKTAAKTAGSQKETTTKGSRSRRAVVDTLEEPTEQPGPQEKPEISRDPASRGKKRSALEDNATGPATHAAPVTRGATVRGERAAVVVEIVPQLAAPVEPKITRATRATKQPPLSPKKITQVSKRTRAAATATKGGSAKSTGPKELPRSRKRRVVSDENADLPILKETCDAETEDEVVSQSNPANKKTNTRRKTTRKPEVAESDVSMSSRATTPTYSPAPTFSDASLDVEDQPSIASSAMADQDSGASEDELCGPKTPMRRSSLRGQARYHESVQRTIQRYEDEIRKHTSARKNDLFASFRQNPQTQEPVQKPASPTYTDRTSVIRQSNSPSATTFLRETDEDSDLVTMADQSFIPDDDIIPMHDDGYETKETMATTSPEIAAEISEDPSPQSVTLIYDESLESTGLQTEAQNELHEAEDLEETLVVHDHAMRTSSPSTRVATSFDTDDTVIITNVEENRVTDDEEGDYGEPMIVRDQASPRKPETMVWGNVHRDVGITVDFDQHLMAPRTLPQPEPTEILDIASMLSQSQAETKDLNDITDRECHSIQPARRESTMSLISAVHAADETVDLSAFIDMDVAGRSEHLDDSLFDLQLNGRDDEKEYMSIEDDKTPAEFEAGPASTEDVSGEPNVPHYALPTIAFDARRKSLPASSMQTPLRLGARPNTSDGTSMPRIANPFTQAWWARTNSAHAAPSTTNTPSKRQASVPNTPDGHQMQTSSKCATPKERYPALASRPSYVDHAQHAKTVAPVSRFKDVSGTTARRRQTMNTIGTDCVIRLDDGTPKEVKLSTPTRKIVGRPESISTPAKTLQATPGERFPKLGNIQNSRDHARTVAPPTRVRRQAQDTKDRRQTFHKAASGRLVTKSPATREQPSPIVTPTVATPQPTSTERYPRLRSRENYMEHAHTVSGPRFQTPTATPAKRPATVQKPISLRKLALQAHTPKAESTPLKMPLKEATMTPAQAPMTPHPAAPLRGVVALVEVFTLEGESASSPFVALLHRLGARTTRTWNERITHVIFKDGSPATLQRLRLQNKSAAVKQIFCVNSRWVTDCDASGTRMIESDEAYAVDVQEIPRGGKRRRKSMEPSTLLNIDGNVVRERKSSFCRSSLRQSSWRLDLVAAKTGTTPAKGLETPTAAEKENSADELESSPATPDWIAEPNKLVQQTAPMNRFHKLELKKDASKVRRLTFWDGGVRE